MPKFKSVLKDKTISKIITEECICLSAPLTVETLDGTDHGRTGDWLITSVHDGKYICKRAEFLRTRKPADAQAEAYLRCHT